MRSVTEIVKKTAMMLAAITIAAAGCHAATPTAAQLLAQAVEQIKKSPSLQATFRASTSDGSAQGSILLSGNRFKLDGRTQWAYSPRTGEVNISEPTFEELAQINPFAVIGSLKDGYNARRVNAPKGSDRLELTPKHKGGDYSKVTLTLNAATHYPSAIEIVATDGARINIAVTSVKAGKMPDASAFRFNRSLYPRAEIVDLR